MLGFDVGGTKIEAALVQFADSAAKVVWRERILTERERGFDSILSKMRELFLHASAESKKLGFGDITSVGVGMPGSVDPATGAMLNGNTNAFVGHDLGVAFRAAFDNKVKIKWANDANLFALAEAYFGAGLEHAQKQGVKTEEALSVGIILGTGCGGGVVYKGKYIEGRNGGFGEIGHTVLVSDGPVCFCGRKGCAELYVSGTGLVQDYRNLSGKSASGAQVFEHSRAGDKLAQKAVENYKEHLVAFLSNLTRIYDPDYFVLGGGVSLQDEIYKNLAERLTKISYLPVTPPPVYKHKLGDSAGVVGAAWLASRT